MQGFWRRFARNRPALFGLAFLGLVVLMALLAPLLYPASPFQIVDKPFQPPFGIYPLGTDSLGRNIAAGIVHGARSSLLIGVVDDALMRVTEFFQTIPYFIFAIVLVAILSPSIQSIVIAIATVSWPPIARLVRGEFMAMRNREFVQASICLGMSDRSIIFGRILPNSLSPIIVAGSLMVATAILIEAALSFLGLGDPNVMSWGFMIGAGRSFLRDAWWLCAIPGIMILLTVLSINLVGEGLNDALNPRLRTL